MVVFRKEQYETFFKGIVQGYN